MSRSYKHTPYVGDTKTKWAKRQANKLVRSKLEKWNIQDELDPSWYKKISESWNICDYYSIMTWKEHLAYRKRVLARGSKPWGMILFEDGDFDIEGFMEVEQKNVLKLNQRNIKIKTLNKKRTLKTV